MPLLILAGIPTELTKFLVLTIEARYYTCCDTLYRHILRWAT